MAQKFWVGVACSSHVRFGQEKGFCAFSHGKEIAVSRLNPGDRFLYYDTKEAFENGAPAGATVQAFIASGTVLDALAEPNDFDGYPAWTRPAEYDPPFHVPVKPLLDKLSFISNPRYWGMAFRRSLFEIPKADFDVVMRAKNG